MKTVLVIVATALAGLCQAQQTYVAHGYINTEPAGCPTRDGAETYDAQGNQTGAIPAESVVSVNLQRHKPGFYWVHGLDFDGKSTSGYVHQGCVTMGNRSSTSKAPRRPATPCEELSATIGAENITAYGEKRLAHYNVEVLNPESVTNPENFDNARKCILSPRVTPAEREAALNIFGAILTHKVKLDSAQEQRDKDRNNSYLLKCADDMDKYKTIAQHEPARLMMEPQMWNDLKEAKRQCWASIGVGMTDTRSRAFDALFGTQEVVSNADLDSFGKINKGWADAYLSTIAKYNQLVNDYNAVLQRQKNLLDLAYQLSQRPVFLWTPPPPPKEIHCTTSGTVSTYGSITISASTDCKEY